ncbi:MAG: hypothetical protein H3Z54_12165 [archaeon]|nr:hypothetical protein [archaeon]
MICTMVKYEKFAEELITEGIDKTIVDKLIDEYRIVKNKYLLGDHETVILHSAKFSELILALIKNKVSGKSVNIDDIHFNKLCEEIRNYPKSSAEAVILTLAIPRVAESVYTIRSKKDIVHAKTIDPSFVDSSYCVSACDWMLSELVLLFFKANENEANELINSILKKKVPTVEEFEDGTIVILRKDLSMTHEILLTFYHYYPERLSNEDLIKLIKSKKIYIHLYRLENERLIHRTKEGSKLTKLGIEYVEDEILMKKT